ncbi:TetR/AcrR family transcriptional regulator [Pseudomonas poae]|jgi:AcrR family transcriptional regulator|nr:TetR/AcrR family transcriptional regulator [Pseudomonas poae]
MRVRTEAKREAIVEAAAQVFLEFGFDGASMAQIATRVGGSKGTLYGYFSSKEELFVEVMHGMAKRYLEPIFEALQKDHDDLRHALQQFGERTLAVLCLEASIQARRAIIAQSGRSDIGLRFYERGPKKGVREVATFLARQVEEGKLRPCDPEVAACHLMALLDSETVMPCLLGVTQKPTPAHVRAAVTRALDTFLAGYALRPDSVMRT